MGSMGCSRRKMTPGCRTKNLCSLVSYKTPSKGNLFIHSGVLQSVSPTLRFPLLDAFSGVPSLLLLNEEDGVSMEVKGRFHL